MRIQDTNRIVKDSRINRHPVTDHHEEGIVSRAWRAVVSVPRRVSGLLRRH